MYTGKCIGGPRDGQMATSPGKVLRVAEIEDMPAFRSYLMKGGVDPEVTPLEDAATYSVFEYFFNEFYIGDKYERYGVWLPSGMTTADAFKALYDGYRRRRRKKKRRA